MSSVPQPKQQASKQNLSLSKLVHQLGSGQKKPQASMRQTALQQSTPEVHLTTPSINYQSPLYKDQLPPQYYAENIITGKLAPINVAAPSTASYYDGDSADQRTEKMNQISYINHLSLNSALTVAQALQLPVPVMKDSSAEISQSQQHFSQPSGNSSANDTVNIKHEQSLVHSDAAGSQQFLQYLPDQIHKMQSQTQNPTIHKPYSLQTYLQADETGVEDETVLNNMVEESQTRSALTNSSRQTTNPSNILRASFSKSQKEDNSTVQVQSQQVSASSNQVSLMQHHNSTSQMTTVLKSQRSGATTPVLMTQSDVEGLDSSQRIRMDASKPTSQIKSISVHKTASYPQPSMQQLVSNLEQKVSSLVLKMEQLRPIAKDASRLLTASAKPQGQTSLRQRAGSNQRVPDFNQHLNSNNNPRETKKMQSSSTTWVASTNTAIAGAQRKTLARKASQGRSKTPLRPESQNVPAELKNQVETLIAKVSESISVNETQILQFTEGQLKEGKKRQQEQEERNKCLQERVTDLQSKLEELKKNKLEKREKRKEAKRSKAMAELKQQMVTSIIAEIKAGQEKTKLEDQTTSLLDPATRAFIEQKLGNDSSSSFKSVQSVTNQNKSDEVTDPIEAIADETEQQVIEVDLEKLTTLNSQPQQRLNSSPSDFSPNQVGSNQERLVMNPITPDRFSPNQHRPYRLDSSATKSDLSRKRSPAQLSQRSAASAQVSTLDQIKLALEKLEAYSLRSSEDINDCIEQLVSCFNSNTNALQRALDDLKIQKASNNKELDQQTVYVTANKILFQFENFADYTRDEVAAILLSLEERKEECQSSLDLLSDKLIPELETKSSCQTALSKNDQVQFEACKEHMQALRLHILNTQQFLQRESSQIEAKITELQVSVVKDIEGLFSGVQGAPLDISRASVGSSMSPNNQQNFIDLQIKPKGHRHTLSQEVIPSSNKFAAVQQRTNLVQILKNMPSTTVHAHNFVNSPFDLQLTPSKDENNTDINRSSLVTKEEEISILCSPQENSSVAYPGGILRSQISTIPEEENDTEYGMAHGDSAATINLRNQNNKISLYPVIGQPFEHKQEARSNK